MLVNDDFDAGLVHAQGLTERTGFAHEYAAALAQGAVECFNYVGLAGLVAPVRVRRQHGGVSRPLIGVVPAVPALVNSLVQRLNERAGWGLPLEGKKRKLFC